MYYFDCSFEMRYEDLLDAVLLGSFSTVLGVSMFYEPPTRRFCKTVNLVAYTISYKVDQTGSEAQRKQKKPQVFGIRPRMKCAGSKENTVQLIHF